MEYTRIQVDYDAYSTGKPAGIFAACHHLRRQGVLMPREDQLFVDVDLWFKENLIEPQFYKAGNPEKAVSWFKPAGGHFLQRLQPLVDLVNSHGMCCHTVRTGSPGKIIYEDDFQIGAV